MSIKLLVVFFIIIIMVTEFIVVSPAIQILGIYAFLLFLPMLLEVTNFIEFFKELSFHFNYFSIVFQQSISLIFALYYVLPLFALNLFCSFLFLVS